MTFDKIDIQQFQNLLDLNTFIDANYFSFEDRHEIIHLLVKFKNITISDEEKERIQWELDLFLFELKGNNLFPFVSSSGKEPGEQINYPDLNAFQLRQFEYLKNRIPEVKCPLLLARYNHLLWKSPKGIKNKKYAIEAIRNYFASIEIYADVAKKNQSNLLQHKIGKLFEHAVSLCSESNSEKDELKKVKDNLLFHTPSISFYTKHGIINDMIEYSKIFKSKDFENVLLIFDSELKKDRTKTDDFALVNYHLPTALKVAQKTNTDVRKWHNEIGFANLRLAESEKEEERNWIKINYYANSIEAFTLAGNDMQVKQATKLYWELKPKIKLNDVKFLKTLNQTKYILKY